MSDNLLLARDGAVATLTMNRPDALNVLDLPMMDALVAHTAALASDSTLRVVVLRGAGKHFMAGGDLRTFATQLSQVPAERRQAEFQRIVDRLHPAIEHAYFSSAYRQIGLSPDGGGTWSLPRIVGLRKALEIYLLSERFDAREAARIGLVNRVVDAAVLDATVQAFARSIATGPALALRNVKRLLRESLDRPLSQQLRAEADSFGQCAADDDFREGIEAFFAKRPPRFR